MPEFRPIRAGGAAGRHRLRRAVRGRRRTVAVGLAVAAAAMAAVPHGRDAAPRSGTAPGTDSARSTSDAAAPAATAAPDTTVSAPVRIADAATVRLLRPGDRVDVIASAAAQGPARVVARRARVTRIPEPEAAPEPRRRAARPQVPDSAAPPRAESADGALVVLTVPRRTATRLAGAAAESRLAVTLC